MFISQSSPRNQVSKLPISPSPGNLNRAVGSGRIPVKSGTGGEGKVRENGEEVEPHLLVAFSRREMVGGGLATASGGRRWPCVAAMALWR